MELHKYNCEVCGDDFETTEVLDLEDEDTDVMCDKCSEEFEDSDEVETEFDDEEEESEDDEDLEDDEESEDEDEDES